MIAPDAEPIDHRPPYKRVDLAARRNRPVEETPQEAAPPPSWWNPVEDLYKAP